jgi:hypothetical protein
VDLCGTEMPDFYRHNLPNWKNTYQMTPKYTKWP